MQKFLIDIADSTDELYFERIAFWMLFVAVFEFLTTFEANFEVEFAVLNLFEIKFAVAVVFKTAFEMNFELRTRFDLLSLSIDCEHFDFYS